MPFRWQRDGTVRLSDGCERGPERDRRQLPASRELDVSGRACARSSEAAAMGCATGLVKGVMAVFNMLFVVSVAYMWLVEVAVCE